MKITHKLIALFLIISLNAGVISRIGYTASYYNDEEISNGNVFSAGMLDIVLSNTDFDGVISNDPGDESQFETNVSLVSGSLPTQYVVVYEKTGGNDSMCGALGIDALGGSVSYNGALSTFSIGTTDNFGLWAFAITVLPGQSVTSGETCEFDLIYKAWMDNAPSFETSGFNDEERFHISIQAVGTESSVVINEFLPNPDGPLCGDPDNTHCDSGDPDFIFDFGKDSDDLPQGEWVELYNLTASPIDLAGWYVQDASGGVGNTQITNLNTLPATTTIPANGFLVIYMNKPVWNNTGDVVKLFNASDVLLDSYAYTSDYDYCYLTPTPGETNDETPSGAGDDCTSGVNIPGNKSYARIPDGTGSFVDPVPTPGARNSFNNVEVDTLLEQFEKTLEVQTESASSTASATSSAPIESLVLESEAATSTSATSTSVTSTEEFFIEETTSTEPVVEGATSTPAVQNLEVAEEPEAVIEEEDIVAEIEASNEADTPTESAGTVVTEEPPAMVEDSAPVEPTPTEPVAAE